MRSAQIRAGGRRRRSVGRTRCSVRASLTRQARGRCAQVRDTFFGLRYAKRSRNARSVKSCLPRQMGAHLCGAPRQPAHSQRNRHRDRNADRTAQTERRRVPATDRLDTRSSYLQSQPSANARSQPSAPVGSAGTDPHRAAVRYGCAPVYQIRSRSPVEGFGVLPVRLGRHRLILTYSGLGCRRSCAAERSRARRGERASSGFSAPMG
jgi:hypothetical protein